MSEVALILGNGASRKGIDLSPFKHIYGCNLAYQEDIDFEWIVATDPAVQHQIYREYGGNKLFLDWEPVPSEMAAAMMSMDTDFTSNEYTPFGCVISGDMNGRHMTYLRKHDNCLSVSESQLPFSMASGALAMWDAAERGFTTIYLAGFGDVDHLHDQKLMDETGRRMIRWEKERRQIIEKYKEIEWVYLEKSENNA